MNKVKMNLAVYMRWDMPRKAKSRKAKSRRGLLHHGLDRYRLKYEWGDLEGTFADAWEKKNSEENNINNILQMLMLRHDKLGFAKRYAFWITQREATIVATVVQWFGTNCGFAFINNVLEKHGFRVVRNPIRKFRFREVFKESSFRLIKMPVVKKKYRGDGYTGEQLRDLITRIEASRVRMVEEQNKVRNLIFDVENLLGPLDNKIIEGLENGIADTKSILDSISEVIWNA